MDTLVQENVTPDVRAERYSAAWDEIDSSKTGWVNGTLKLAAVVLELRTDYPNHVEFSRWVKRNVLREITKDNHTALRWMATNPETARKAMEETGPAPWRTIYNKWGKSGTPRKAAKGTTFVRTGAKSRKLKREPRIPTVMQEGYEPGELAAAAAKQPVAERPAKRRRRGSYGPAPERKAVNLKGLTREQVDPDFKGTALEFTAIYGQVQLQTKQEIEYNKRQEELMAFIGLVSDHEKTALAITTAMVDSTTLQEWLGKPSKAQKFRTWVTNIQYTCENLRKILGLPENEPDREARPTLSMSMTN